MIIRILRQPDGLHHFGPHDEAAIGLHHDNPRCPGPHPQSAGYRSRLAAAEAAIAVLGDQVEGFVGTGSDFRRWCRVRGVPYRDLRRDRRSTRGHGKPVPKNFAG
jgi:hypothetical protein